MNLVNDIRSRLSAAFGQRLKGIVLYGSEARGDAGLDSDIDVLVLLDGPIRLWNDIHTSVRSLYPLSLECGRCISPKPVDVRTFEEARFPLYRQAQIEGIRA